MKASKRIISTILFLALLTGMVPTAVQAEELQTTVETGGTTIEGTNGFGGLLSKDIQEYQAVEEEGYSGGYNVIGLTIEEGIATVEYDTLEEAVLIVALYTEDGLKLLTSGNKTVRPEETVAEIVLEGEIPEYFMASAYLVDTYDYSPLCAAYDTPMYTKEMQDLLASTTDDYDADKVLNLDDDKTTNFAVYADSTKVIEYVDGVNTVISADDETATYVIGNADDNITGLQIGDVFAYAYGDNHILIVKVASVALDGSTATIIGNDLDMEEAFAYVKVEGKSETADIFVDESTGDDGVTYVGGSNIRSYGLVTAVEEGDITKKDTIGFDIEKEVGAESTKIKGSLYTTFEMSFCYYISFSRQFLEYKMETSTEISIAVEGDIDVVSIPLPKLKCYPVPGVGIGLEPEFQVKVSAKIEVSCSVGFTIGASYESGKGITDLSTRPKVEADLDVEGSIFVGIDWSPTIDIAEGTVFELKLKALTGVEFKGEMEGTGYEPVTVIGGAKNEDSIHTCEKCLACKVEAKTEFSLEIEFLNCELLTVKSKVTLKEFEIGIFYYSFDHSEFGWGTCPYISHRVTVYVKDSEGESASDVKVTADWKDVQTEILLGTTNSNGVVVGYLQAGDYAFMATVDGKKLTKAEKVEEACKVVLDSKSIDKKPIFISGTDTPITDNGIVASGECGANGDNVTWTLYGSGLLEIKGSGPMCDYVLDEAPWYSNRAAIKTIVIEDGVTSIGSHAFEACSLTIVKIPGSVTSIGDSGFFDCSSLNNVTIPDSVISIGKNAFSWCESLSSIAIPEGVTSIGDCIFYGCSNLVSIAIPDSLTSIGDGAFWGCSSLTSIEIPEGVTSIGDSIFSGCSNLASMTIPDGVTSIGDFVFFGCSSLTSVTIPDSVISIGRNAFSWCESLSSIAIPEGVTSIGDYIFYGCSNLVSIAIPDSLTSIGDGAFRQCFSLNSIVIPNGTTCIGEEVFTWCSSLTSITIPDGVVSIGNYAFSYCENLANVKIPDSLTSIGEGAFWECSDLTSITIPNNVTSIGKQAFYGCSSLNSVTIPNGVTIIDDWTFGYCRSLSSITIPDSVTSIGEYAFCCCSSLADITVPDSMTSIAENAFYYITTTAYYPANNAIWTSDMLQNYGGNITWIPYTLDENGNMVIDESAGVAVTAPLYATDAAENAVAEQETGKTKAAELGEISENMGDPIAPFSIWGGEYGTEIDETYVVKTASFTGLVPEAEYVLLALVSIETEDILIPDNLLYIDQGTAGKDGTLAFRYVQREETDVSYVVACGPSNKNLADATIAFPDMHADGETHVVTPVVTYEGKTLTEDLDYVIIGDVDYTDAGEYTCCIRGIRNYTGLVECKYTVTKDTHTHSFTDYVNDGNATCVKDATKTAKCDGCDAVDTVVDKGTALGHSWKTATCTAAKTCTVCGEKTGKVAPHTYDDIVDGTCNVCSVKRENVEIRQVVHMFRMYNPNTGEHFYTGSTVERDNLIEVGWQYEGVGFTFPANTGAPVYRLFHEPTGEHLYTMDKAEKEKLEAEGWNYEGIAFNSAYNTEAVQHRLHNPNATVGAYHFTFSLEEKQNLIDAGWEYQGIGWYSCWK